MIISTILVPGTSSATCILYWYLDWYALILVFTPVLVQYSTVYQYIIYIIYLLFILIYK